MQISMFSMSKEYSKWVAHDVLIVLRENVLGSTKRASQGHEMSRVKVDKTDAEEGA